MSMGVAAMSDASSPERPTARTPSRTSEETSRLLAVPERAMRTNSRSGPVVTRGPSTNLEVIPNDVAVHDVSQRRGFGAKLEKGLARKGIAPDRNRIL